MVLVPENNQSKKMVEKVKSYVTFGEINKEILEKVLGKRGLITGNKKISIEVLKEMKMNSFSELTEKILSEEIKLKETKIKPVFRLRPPRKGFERAGIKKSFTVGGALGYRGKEINELINKMI